MFWRLRWWSSLPGSLHLLLGRKRRASDQRTGEYSACSPSQAVTCLRMFPECANWQNLPTTFWDDSTEGLVDDFANFRELAVNRAKCLAAPNLVDYCRTEPLRARGERNDRKSTAPGVASRLAWLSLRYIYGNERIADYSSDIQTRLAEPERIHPTWLAGCFLQPIIAGGPVAANGTDLDAAGSGDGDSRHSA